MLNDAQNGILVNNCDARVFYFPMFMLDQMVGKAQKKGKEEKKVWLAKAFPEFELSAD